MHLWTNSCGRVKLEASRLFLVITDLNMEVLLDSTLVWNHADELTDLRVGVRGGRERKQATRVHEVVLSGTTCHSNAREHAVDRHPAIFNLTSAA